MQACIGNNLGETVSIGCVIHRISISKQYNLIKNQTIVLIMLYYPRCRIGCYKFLLTLPQPTRCNMLQLQKYTWLIDTIRKAGKISLEEISDRWERIQAFEPRHVQPMERCHLQSIRYNHLLSKNRWLSLLYRESGGH